MMLTKQSLTRPLSIRFLGSLLIFVGTTLTVRPVAADETLQEQIDRLVAELNAAELTVREAAEQSLVDLAAPGREDGGPRVLTMLPEINDRMPPEVRHRLTRVRQAVEEAAAKAAVNATRVTLTGTALDVADVFKTVTEQTGNRFFYEPDENATVPQIDLELEDANFWNALDKILDEADLDAEDLSGDDAMQIVARSESRLPRSDRATYAGPMRIEVTGVRAHRNARDTSQQSLRVEIEVAWEPRLKPIRIAQSLPSVEATDGSGNPLEVTSQSEPEFPVMYGYQAAKMQIPLSLPDRSVQEIASLKGKLRVLLPGKEETFRFGELQTPRPVTQSRGGVAVTVRQCRENGGIWEVHMTVGFDDPAGALESHMGWVLQNESHLVGPDNKKIEHVGFETIRQSQTEISLVYLFELPEGTKDLAGIDWLYITPAALVDVPIAFELTDVALP